MGMGDYPMGLGLAGADPVYKPVPPALVLVPRAVKYDPSIKQYVLFDVNGNAIDVHPVDQIVAIRLTTEQGQSASSPLLGTRIRSLCRAAAQARHQQIAQSEVNRVLKDLIDAGDAKIISVVAQRNPINMAEIFIVTYVNLRAQLVNPRYPQMQVVVSTTRT